MKGTDQISLVNNPRGINRYNLNNITREARRHFRNKEIEFLKYKINEFPMVSKN
jgi:hypothetical protein